LWESTIKRTLFIGIQDLGEYQMGEDQALSRTVIDTLSEY